MKFTNLNLKNVKPLKHNTYDHNTSECGTMSNIKTFQQLSFEPTFYGFFLMFQNDK